MSDTETDRKFTENYPKPQNSAPCELNKTTETTYRQRKQQLNVCFETGGL